MGVQLPTSTGEFAGCLLSTVSLHRTACDFFGNQSATCFVPKSGCPLHDEVMKTNDFCQTSWNPRKRNYLGPLGGVFWFLGGMNHLFIHFISFQFNSIHSISFIQLLSNYCTLRLPPPQKLNSHRQCFMSFDWRMVDYRDVYIIYLTINIAYTIPVYISIYPYTCIHIQNINILNMINKAISTVPLLFLVGSWQPSSDKFHRSILSQTSWGTILGQAFSATWCWNFQEITEGHPGASCPIPPQKRKLNTVVTPPKTNMSPKRGHFEKKGVSSNRYFFHGTN